MRTRVTKFFIASAIAIIVGYGSFAVYVYTQAKKDSNNTYVVTGKIIQLSDVPTRPWGLQADWDWHRSIVNRNFRFADLPSAWQRDGQHVVIEYQIQDVIGGEWGVIIHIVSIQKN